MASSGVGTSSVIYSFAISNGSPEITVSLIIISAKGSKPRSRAIIARVRFFGRYGKYKSSNSCSFVAASKDFINSSVIFSCSVIEAMISWRRVSKLRKYLMRSSMVRNCSSCNSPVTSLRYRAINGTVLPSSNNSTAACTCFGLTFNSLPIMANILSLI